MTPASKRSAPTPRWPIASGDGLTDREEIAYNTNELKADSDGDGFSDYFEIRQGWPVGYLTTGGTLLQTRVWPESAQQRRRQ
jgi:hypothetical protein